MGVGGRGFVLLWSASFSTFFFLCGDLGVAISMPLREDELLLRGISGRTFGERRDMVMADRNRPAFYVIQGEARLRMMGSYWVLEHKDFAWSPRDPDFQDQVHIRLPHSETFESGNKWQDKENEPFTETFFMIIRGSRWASKAQSSQDDRGLRSYVYFAPRKRKIPMLQQRNKDPTKSNIRITG